MRRLFLTLLIFVNCICLQAQDKFIGKVIDKKTSVALDAVSVVYKTKEGITIAFGLTDEKGIFLFNAPHEIKDSSYLEIRTLGYASYSIINPKVNYEYEVMLSEEAFKLKNVNVKAKKFVHSNDTTRFIVGAYSRVEDRSIGDVLANMPGFEVSPSGRVSYNGKSVTDFYIEGMDMLGNRYGIATRNLSHDAIASVDVIENHQRIKAIEEQVIGTGTAVNLNLKENSKMHWIGNVQTAAGASSEGDILWDAALFLSAFKPKYQTMSTIKSNNTGKDIALENELMSGSEYRVSSAIPDVSGRLIEATPLFPQAIEPKNALFNHTHIVNNSQMWKLSNSTQLKLQTTYTDQHLDNTAVQTDKIYLEDSVQCRINREDSKTIERKVTAQLSLEANKKSRYLKDELSVDARWNYFDIEMVGDIANNQNVSNNKIKATNELQYVKPFGQHILGISSSAHFSSHPERLEIEYAKGNSYNTLIQALEKHKSYADITLSYGLKLGSVFVSNQVGSAISFAHTETALSSNADNSKSVDISDNEINTNYTKFKYHVTATWDNNKTKIKIDLPIDYLYYFRPSSKAEGHAYFLPAIRIEHKFNLFFEFNVRYAFGTSESDKSSYIDSPILRSYRIIRGSYWDMKGSKINKGAISLKLTDYEHTIFGNVSVSYSGKNTRWGTSQRVIDDFIIYSYVPREQQSDTYSSELWLNKGIDALNGKLQLRGVYSKTNSEIEQNNKLRKYESDSWMAEARLSAVFSQYLSAVYSPKYYQNGLTISGTGNTYRELSQGLDLNIHLIKHTTLKLSASWLMQSQNESAFQHTILSNAEFTYTYKKWKFYAIINNIFDKHSYIYTTYGVLSSSDLQYNLRPRVMMLGGSFQF
mgnify:FL=1